MECCGITQTGTKCTRKVNGKNHCHKHSDNDNNNTPEEKCAIIKDVTQKKMQDLLKFNPNLTDLEYNSTSDCNCSLLASTSKFSHLHFLTITLDNFCNKKDVSLWNKFNNLLYLSLSLKFQYETQLFDIINNIPILEHLIISDLDTLTHFNLPPANEILHTLILKGSGPAIHNLESFLHIKRLEVEWKR